MLQGEGHWTSLDPDLSLFSVYNQIPLENLDIEEQHED